MSNLERSHEMALRCSRDASYADARRIGRALLHNSDAVTQAFRDGDREAFFAAVEQAVRDDDYRLYRKVFDTDPDLINERTGEGGKRMAELYNEELETMFFALLGYGDLK